MEKGQAEQLWNKYLRGDCTPEEKAIVESWYVNEFKELDDDPVPDYDLVKENIWQQMMAKQQPVRKINILPRIAAAASIILCLGFGAYFYFHNRPVEQVAQNQPAKNDIAPGGNKAVLTLANGRKISLTDAKSGNIAQQAGVSITKTAAGQVVYAVSHNNHTTGALEYNTIKTPRGGQYEVHLPDGTSVWLNAASSLKYPASFASLKERTVELSGEGYFQVAKDKAHPFIVKTSRQQVKVLGTHFNISAYNDERSVRTTLLEGSVNVSSAIGNKTIVPGQQAVLDDSGLSAAEANTEEAVAWKNGYFRFNSENLESIMKQLSRWYNIDVTYEKDVRSKRFTGKISRFKNISQVLKMLGKTKTVHFKVEEGRVIVTE